MSKPSISRRLAEKSLNAAKSAIEIYNKPNFDYKMEAFVVLMINSWELLFKAYILKKHKNKLQSILIQDKSATKKWQAPKRFYPKRNRSWNELTIDIFSSMKKLDFLDLNLLSQIEVLVEVRDNAIHFLNDAGDIESKLLEIATATVKNFVMCFREWFSEIDFNDSILPIWFQLNESFSSIGKKWNNQELLNLLTYIQNKESKSIISAHAISFVTEIQLKRSLHSWISVSNDRKNPNSIPLKVVDTDLIDTKYKIDYHSLKEELKKRKTGIKFDKKFHTIHATVKANKELSLQRLLDPRNPQSIKKQFYSQQAIDFILEKLK